MHRLTLVALVFLVAGCSTAIQSTPVATNNTDVESGILYYLPASAIEASMTFVPTSCQLADGKITFNYEITDAVVKQSFVQDTTRQFLFDFTKLNSALKLTSANVEMYRNGTIKSINTSVEDRSGEVIGAIGGMALNLVKATTFVAGAPVADGGKSTGCSPAITEQLAQLATYRAALAKARAADNALQKELDALEKEKSALAAAQAKLKATADDAALKTEVTKLSGSVKKLEKAVKERKPQAPDIQKQLTSLLELLTAQAHVLFVPSVEDKCKIAKVAGAGYLGRFQPFKADKPGETDPLDEHISGVGRDAVFTASICVTPPSGKFRTKPQVVRTKTESEEVKNPGIMYRLPVLALVTISQSEDSRTDFSGERWISVPQYGTIASLDLDNGAFDKNTLKLAFAEDGSLATLDFTAEASAERGALAAQAASKTYLDIVTARENAKQARDKATDEKEKKERSDEITRYEDELKLLTAQDAIKAKVIGKDPVQAAIDATTLETTLLKKQIERETARRELEKLKDGAP